MSPSIQAHGGRAVRNQSTTDGETVCTVRRYRDMELGPHAIESQGLSNGRLQGSLKPINLVARMFKKLDTNNLDRSRGFR